MVTWITERCGCHVFGTRRTSRVAANAEMSGRFGLELSASGHHLKGANDPKLTRQTVN
jgi:hypothetical protein